MKRVRTSLRFGSALLVIVGAVATCLAIVTGTAGVATAQTADSYSVEAVGSTKTVSNVSSDLSDLAIDTTGRWIAVVNNYAVGELSPSGSGYQMSALVGQLDRRDSNFDVEGIDYLEGNLYAVTLEGRSTSELRIYELTRTTATLKQRYALSMPVNISNKGAEGVVLQKITKTGSNTQYTFLTATEGYSGVKPQLYSFTIQANGNNFSSTVTQNWGPVVLRNSTESTALEIDPKTGHLLVLTEKGENRIDIYELGTGSVKFLQGLAPIGPFTRMTQPEGLAFNPKNADQLMVVGEENEVLELRVKRTGTTPPSPGTPVEPNLTQDCYYFGDEASSSLAGTIIQRRLLTLTNQTNQMLGYTLRGSLTQNGRPGLSVESAFSNTDFIPPGETGSVTYQGRNPGERVNFRYYRDGKAILDNSPGITCSVPMQQNGSRRVPAPREETLGVRIGQDCVRDDNWNEIDRVYPIITNTTGSTQTYLVEWNWENDGFGVSPFQWPPNETSSGFGYTAQNYFESGNSKTKQRIVLQPGESTPPASIVHSGRKSGQIVGIRVLRGSSISDRDLRLHQLSRPADGQEIFKATIRTSQCGGDYAEIVEAVQECQYKLKRDTPATAPSSRENRLRVIVNNREASGKGVYTAKFIDDTNDQLIQTELIEIKAGTTGTVTLAGRKDGERIRVEVDSPGFRQADRSFTTTINACASAYDH